MRRISLSPCLPLSLSLSPSLSPPSGDPLKDASHTCRFSVWLLDLSLSVPVSLSLSLSLRRAGSGVLFQLDFLFVRKDSVMVKNAQEYVFGWVSPGG